MSYELSNLQTKLLDSRILDINGSVDGKMVLYVREALTILATMGSPPIEVRICSSGGGADAGLDIYDLLRLYKGKKTGIVFCYARSMAAIILQACDQRHCARHAVVLIHHVNVSEGNVKYLNLDFLNSKKKINELIKDMKRWQLRLYRILEECSGKPRKLIRQICSKDEDMSAEEARRLGLIDKII